MRKDTHQACGTFQLTHERATPHLGSTPDRGKAAPNLPPKETRRKEDNMKIADVILHAIDTSIALATLIVTIWAKPGHGRHRKDR